MIWVDRLVLISQVDTLSYNQLLFQSSTLSRCFMNMYFEVFCCLLTVLSEAGARVG